MSLMKPPRKYSHDDSLFSPGDDESMYGLTVSKAHKKLDQELKSI